MQATDSLGWGGVAPLKFVLALTIASGPSASAFKLETLISTFDLRSCWSISHVPQKLVFKLKKSLEYFD